MPTHLATMGRRPESDGSCVLGTVPGKGKGAKEMNKLWIAAIFLGLAGCKSASTNGYAHECVPAELRNPSCKKIWVPTAIDFGESVSLGFSSAARIDLADSVDYRHDDWQAENIIPENDEFFSGAVVSRGINDGNSQQLLQRMEAALKGHFYAVIIMNSVTHDITVNPNTHLPEVTLSDYRDNVEAIAQLAKQHTSVAIWLDTPPIPEGSLGPFVQPSEVQAYNAVADVVMREHGFYMLAVPGTDHIPGANVHYTRTGYKILGREVADCVMISLKGSQTDECHR